MKKIIVLAALAWMIIAVDALAQSNVVTVSPSTMAVTALPSIPAGSNVIGHVICDSGCSSSGSPTFGAAFSSSGTPVGFTDGVNMQAGKVFDLDSGGGTDYAIGMSLRIVASGGSIPITAGAGATAAGTVRVALANDIPQQAAATPLAVRPSDGTSFISDAAIGVAPTSNPVPFACHNETTPTTIANTQTGMPECDTSQRLLVVGSGTAGTAAGGILTIQGVASMTKLLVTPDSIALPANQSVNVSQMNGVTTTMNNGVAGTGVQRVAVASDNTPFGIKPWSDGTLSSGAVTSAMTGTTSTSVIAGTASYNIYLSQCTVSNASLTVSTDILLQDGSGGTTLYVIPAPAATVATTGGAGAVVPFPTPLKVTTNGNGLFAANVTTGSSTKISCSGFKSTTSY